MRMFVALYPSEEAVAHLAGLLGPLETTRESEAEATPSIRWIPPERWHITLAFLAEVDPDRVERLQESLSEVAAQHGSLQGLHLTGAGAFGPTVWVGVDPTDPGTPAEALAKAVQRASRSVGIDVERHPWRAHLSIARLRTRDRAEAKSGTAALVSRLSDYSGPTWRATDITLVHTILGPQPEHTPVGRYALG